MPLTTCCVSGDRTPVLQSRVEWAVREVEKCAQTLGWSEMLRVAEELCFEYGVTYDPDALNRGEGGMTFEFSDIQTVAYAAALRARVEYFK